LIPVNGIALICVLQLVSSFAAELGHAQTRKPTANEVASIRDCASKNKDDLDQGERRCLFNLVAERCIKRSGGATKSLEVDCYRIENSIWDGLLNDNYRALLDTLDADQAAKAQAMQRAWMAYRDTTCEFYHDKIQGSMAITCMPLAKRASRHGGQCCLGSSTGCKRQYENTLSETFTPSSNAP
jgi:uncharacterized protein YecT (DUF1311 family)